MNVAESLEFVRAHHNGVLATRRRDGGVQMSPITAGVDAAGRIVISSRETAIKTKNVRREPRAAVCMLSDGFYGDWWQIEGPAEIESLPDAMDGLVEYYRGIAGEHPDWDDYRAAMQREQRVLIRITPERVGPTVSG
ncbi:MAG TPA: PPOX class F420-dependent oxidoreductase [Acidimicrobiia bacterium]|nr:PPOX class F420-dependent oxidoreductase [Acidimicrobiia bacterium]